jgi:hypothetical protein
MGKSENFGSFRVDTIISKHLKYPENPGKNPMPDTTTQKTNPQKME